jgi:hypothetical protein
MMYPGQGALAHRYKEEKGMSERPRTEREEKQEKNDGGGWDEKWRRDPVDAVMWAVLLIWAGIVLLVSNFTSFAGYEKVPLWALGFIGAGVIVLLAAAFRLVVPAYRRPLTGNVILAVVLIGIGLGETVGWFIIGPLVLIGIGVAALLSGFLRRL